MGRSIYSGTGLRDLKEWFVDTDEAAQFYAVTEQASHFLLSLRSDDARIGAALVMGFMRRDLPLKFHPADIRASAVCTPCGAG